MGIVNGKLSQVTAALKKGQTILVVDDGSRRTSAYLVCPAAHISPDDVTYMVTHAKGIVCAAISEQRMAELRLPKMPGSAGPDASNPAVSVEAREGVTTGISAADRAKTLRTLALSVDPERELVAPGHIFPWQAQSGGVLVRSYITEAAVDLMGVAKLPPVAAFCQCLDSSGELLSPSALEALVDELSCPSISISDIIRERLASESIVEKIAEAQIPLDEAGTFRAIAFRSKTDDAEHLALIRGTLDNRDDAGVQKPVLVRVQAEHRIRDLLSIDAFSHKPVIMQALRSIAKENRGVFLYVRHPRKGAVKAQIEALSSQGEREEEEVTTGLREFGIGAQMLRYLGVERLRLLTTSPRDVSGLGAFDLEVVEQLPFDNPNA